MAGQVCAILLDLASRCFTWRLDRTLRKPFVQTRYCHSAQLRLSRPTVITASTLLCHNAQTLFPGANGMKRIAISPHKVRSGRSDIREFRNWAAWSRTLLSASNANSYIHSILCLLPLEQSHTEYTCTMAVNRSHTYASSNIPSRREWLSEKCVNSRSTSPLPEVSFISAAPMTDDGGDNAKML